jgi:hypothetical protein
MTAVVLKSQVRFGGNNFSRSTVNENKKEMRSEQRKQNLKKQ